MNYKIIQNREKLEEFISWLPDLKPQERFYVTLFARNKYTEIRLPYQCQIKRFTASKNMLLHKIEALEIRQGTYKFGDTKIPQESLALYIMMNPRDLHKATKQITKDFIDILAEGKICYNPEKGLMSTIHKSKSYTKYMTFDFDTKTPEIVYPEILEYINPESCTVIRTYEGFHLLVEPEKVSSNFKGNWYQGLKNIEACDNVGDLLTPVVGCTQGDFAPHFINLPPK